MPFTKKTWKNRQSEYPTRRRLTFSDSSTEIVTVERSEGEVQEQGDAFSAANMNDLEDRVEDGFSSVDDSLEAALTDVNTAVTNINSRISGITKFQRMTQTQWDALSTKPSAGTITFVRE